MLVFEVGGRFFKPKGMAIQINVPHYIMTIILYQFYEVILIWSYFEKNSKKDTFMSYNYINVFVGGYIELNEINANSTRNSQVASSS